MGSQVIRKIPVLGYHSHRVLGNIYDVNDHIALFQDLRTIHAQGFRIVPLQWVVEWVLGEREDSLMDKTVAISFDDGMDFDFYDFPHPVYGLQRSFFGILRDFQAEFGSLGQSSVHASSFVIASPVARREIDAHSLEGRNWMTDGWWREANSSGLMGIYNHSWDHNHPDVEKICEENQIKGSFEVIDTYTECQVEVAEAAKYIQQKISPAWPDIFAYPWGQSSEYLRETYFPQFFDQHRTIAAFAAGGGYVTKVSSRWNLPRFGSAAPWPEGWNSTERLIQILQGAL